MRILYGMGEVVLQPPFVRHRLSASIPPGKPSPAAQETAFPLLAFGVVVRRGEKKKKNETDL
jgi:hypothetical protein